MAASFMLQNPLRSMDDLVIPAAVRRNLELARARH
jgi:hypothetical protein